MQYKYVDVPIETKVRLVSHHDVPVTLSVGVSRPVIPTTPIMGFLPLLYSIIILIWLSPIAALFFFISIVLCRTTCCKA